MYRTVFRPHMLSHTLGPWAWRNKRWRTQRLTFVRPISGSWGGWYLQVLDWHLRKSSG